MPPDAKLLGVLTPMGGGDPVSLRRDEMSVGRRSSCDIRLDFENVSGKHCALRLLNGIWHVRDLGSTNGTTVNGVRLERDRDRAVLPDDQLGISGHFFSIDYDPATAVANSKQILEAELAEPRRRSFLELAGLDDQGERTDPASRARRPSPRPAPEPPPKRANSAPTPPRRAAAPAPEPEPDSPSPPAFLPLNGASSEDSAFFRLIKDDVDRDNP